LYIILSAIASLRFTYRTQLGERFYATILGFRGVPGRSIFFSYHLHNPTNAKPPFLANLLELVRTW